MEPFVLVIFGITGNLAQIKLIPALYDIAEKNLLPSDSQILGVARSPKESADFKNYVQDVLNQENRHHHHPIKSETFEKLASQMNYMDGHLDDPYFYEKLKNYLDSLGSKGHNRIFYLATYPDLYQQVFENLKKSGLNSHKDGYVRLIVEKPIGNDLESSKKLNKLLLEYFSEDQIYRLDHYLGKETLQNIITFRFGNGLFEPLINKDHIDHIQITASENFGIGQRGGYYDTVGALKDFGQNHILQMIALATMDAPKSTQKSDMTQERINILEKLIPMPDKLVLGQYEGYKQEPNVNPDSQTDSFYAFKTEIDNPRFKGVPIYIRGGKNLSQWVTEIVIVFKVPETRLVHGQKTDLEPNVLIYRIQPNEGIVLKILTKKPGHDNEMQEEYMQYCYPQDPNGHGIIDAYEKLIFDAIKGDQLFFNEAAEVEAEWNFIDILTKNLPKTIEYKPLTWGPKEADELIEADGRKWLEPSMQFCKF